MSKDVTFHINNEAYTINIGEDEDNMLENSIKKFLSTDEPLTTKEVLLAYLRRTQEFVNFQKEIEEEIDLLPTIEKLKPNLEKIKPSLEKSIPNLEKLTPNLEKLKPQ